MGTDWLWEVYASTDGPGDQPAHEDKNMQPQCMFYRHPLHKRTREDVWPASTPMRIKLYAWKQQLEKAAKFTSSTALILLPTNAKKTLN